MRKTVRQSPAMPLGTTDGLDTQDAAPPRSRLNPAVGVAIAFSASIVLWSLLARVLSVVVHSIF